ncbi:MFS transporter [Pseudotenacibaculum haliotis]|uniref:MFS transporter n=1 Tax=Pseudotenacibaculum haliotis TaxID=1862138 RepID=A0ABW5LMH5_9FLAO
MEKLQKATYTSDHFFLAFSRMFERTSFYGVRALLVLYMIGETHKMSDIEAIELYGLFASAVLISQIIGGVLGDLLLKNKRALLLGGLVQVLGCFALCFSNKTGLYTGLVLIVLGTGFYSSNFIAIYGKSFLKNTKLLDSGFTLLYALINIGSFFGVLFIGLFAEKDFRIGFAIAGGFMILSVALPLFAKRINEVYEKSSEFLLGKSVLFITVGILAVTMFWNVYSLSATVMFDMERTAKEIVGDSIIFSGSGTLNIGLVVILGIILAIVWTKVYTSSYVKIILGCLAGFGAFCYLHFNYGQESNTTVSTFIIATTFFTIAEILIAPVLYSIITKYSNPKYLAIVASLVFIPSKILDRFLSNDSLIDESHKGIFELGMTAFFGLSIFVLVLIIFDKRHLTKS